MRESRQQMNTKKKTVLHKWVNQHLRKQIKGEKGLQDSCEKLKHFHQTGTE